MTTVAIYILLFVIAVAPLRFAYIGLITIVHFDSSGPDFDSSVSVGIENLLKIFLAPLLLIIRQKLRPLIEFLDVAKKSPPIVFYSLLCIYSVFALIWTPEILRLGAIKGVGYLIAYLIWFIVIYYGVDRARIKLNDILIMFFVSVLIAALHGFFYGSFGNSGDFQRFTVFASPQSYAAYLLYLCIIGLFFSRGLYAALFVLLMYGVVIFLTGSRYILIGFFGVAVVWFLYYLFSARNVRLFVGRAAPILITLMLSVAVIGQLYSTNVFQMSRFGELFGQSVVNVGTFSWRISMWEHTLTELERSSLREFLFGHGTSTGGLVAIGFDLRYDTDALDVNRVIHNEFLRTLYEWGVLGLLLLVCFWVGLFLLMIRNLLKNRVVGYFFAAVLIPLTSGLFVENIMSASGSPSAVGLVMALSFGRVLIDRRI